MKTGLVLEGGALRGLFSVGVCDVLTEHGFAPDGIVGVSAGAAFGCNIKSHQPGRPLRYNKLMAHEWRYCSLRSLIKTGDLFGGDYCYHYMPNNIDLFDAETFNTDPTEFFAVCTDLDTGKAVYKRLMTIDYETEEWFRASASMPLCSKIVVINGQRLLDGGIADSIPLRFMQERGYERNIVVLTQPEGYTKEKNRFLPLMKMVYRKYPRFVDAIARRHEMYNEQLQYVEEQEKAGNTFVIRPPEKLPVNHITHDTDVMQRTYDIGRNTAMELLKETNSIRGFLDNE
ncbi:MAG: patatin family protein [Prevotella sp.]|nr:patatin family protein [Prevotella sp.]